MKKILLVLMVGLLGLASWGGGELSSSSSVEETSSQSSSGVPWTLSSIASLKAEGEEGGYYVIRGCITYKLGSSFFLQDGLDALEVKTGSHTSLVSTLAVGSTVVVSGKYTSLSEGLGYEPGIDANLSDVTCAVAEIPLGDEVEYQVVSEPEDLLENHASMVNLTIRCMGEGTFSYKEKEIVLEGNLPQSEAGEEYTYQGPCLAREVEGVLHLKVLEERLLTLKA